MSPDEIHVGQLRDGDVTVLGDLIDAEPLYPAAEPLRPNCHACGGPIEVDDPVGYVTISTLGNHQVAVHAEHLEATT